MAIKWQISMIYPETPIGSPIRAELSVDHVRKSTGLLNTENLQKNYLAIETINVIR